MEKQSPTTRLQIMKTSTLDSVSKPSRPDRPHPSASEFKTRPTQSSYEESTTSEDEAYATLSPEYGLKLVTEESVDSKRLNQLRGRPVNIDLIRAVAMVGVILLHASGRFVLTTQEMSQMGPMEITRWGIVDIYQSVAVPLGVPLFLMLTGALLLQPEKKDTIGVFFRKRWARIGLPSLFWGSAYFAWDFLVQKIPFSAAAIVQGILNGPYTQMWYLYVLIGLYLLTPILRVFVAHADQTILKYFVILWVLGVAILPFFGLFTDFQLNSNVFALTGYVGFFVLGTYLSMVQIRSSTKSILVFIISIALTGVGTYALAATVGGTEMYFFQQYFSPTVVLGSVSVFLLLLTIKPRSTQQDTSASLSKVNGLIKLISQNTLGIFFIHVMIIESIEKGYFGFAINHDTLNPIIATPLLTLITLFASLAIILILKRVPYLNRLIGAMSA